MKTFREFLVCLAFAFSAPAEVWGNELQDIVEPQMLFGCWRLAEGLEETSRGKIEVFCFNARGEAPEYSFDAQSDFQLLWKHTYKVSGNRFRLDDFVWMQVVKIDKRWLELKRHDGKLQTYRFICQTEPEDEKCEQLRQGWPKSFEEFVKEG